MQSLLGPFNLPFLALPSSIIIAWCWSCMLAMLACSVQQGVEASWLSRAMQTARDTASSFLAGSVLLGAAGGPEACMANGRHGPTASNGITAGAAGAAADGSQGLEERRRSSLEASTSLGVFELIEGSAAEAAGSSPAWTRARPPPLTLAELETFFDAEGEERLALPCHALLCHATLLPYHPAPCHAIAAPCHAYHMPNHSFAPACCNPPESTSPCNPQAGWSTLRPSGSACMTEGWSPRRGQRCGSCCWGCTRPARHVR